MQADLVPDDDIFEILKFLPVRDVLACRLVCKKFKKATEHESLWKFFCLKDYQVADKQLWDGWRYKDFYANVLHKFRFILGWFKRDLTPYGGLFHVQVEKDGLNCYDILPPLDACFLDCDSLKDDVVRSSSLPADRASFLEISAQADYSPSARHRPIKHRLFSLTHVGKRLRVYCYQSDVGLQDGIGHGLCGQTGAPHQDCRLACSDGTTFLTKDSLEGFRFNCINVSAHSDLNFNYWFALEHGFRVSDQKMLEKTLLALFYSDHYYIRNKKFDAFAKSADVYDLEPLGVQWSVPPSVFPAQATAPRPGLYFGTYSVHGWEILNLHYVTFNGRWVVEGWKVTGDPNVPCGQLSFRVFLDRPLILSGEESWEGITDRLARNPRPDSGCLVGCAEFQTQAFRVPEDCMIRVRDGLPRWCRGRFLAEGQIAGNNFKEPSMIPCVLSVFHEGMLSILWVGLQTLATYYRMDETVI